MDPFLLKQVIIDQKQISLPQRLVARDIDMKAIMAGSHIVVIAGIRRCGKSTLLQLIRQELKESSYYINFDDDRLVQFTISDCQTLLELFMELYGEQRTFFFDEIQNIIGCERFVRRLHDNGNKIYLTGSNAVLFSKELGTRLTGRYVQIQLYPFSFKEYLNYHRQSTLIKKNLKSNEKVELKRYFNHFFLEGGIPEYIQEHQIAHLQALYESIIYRDIIVRYHIENVHVFKELVYCLASNMGKEVSYNALRKQLNVASPSTISNYCDFLENSFLCFFINRFDFSLKKQMHYAKKIYFIDQALAKAVGFRMDEEKGRVLENIVFMELKRRNKEIYFHKDKKECDFLVKEGNKITEAIQVCYYLDSDKTKEREVGGLLEAMSLYKLKEGFILTENTFKTENITVDHQSYLIHILPVWYYSLKDS